METWEYAILKSQYQSRKQLRFLSIVLFLLPLSLVRITNIVPAPFWIALIICWPVACYFLFRIKHLNEFHAKNPLQILRFTPDSIVWVYHNITQTAPLGLVLFQRHTIVFATKSGDRFSVYLSEHQELHSVLEEIHTICPRACKGFSLEKEQLFEIHPENLIDYP